MTHDLAENRAALIKAEKDAAWREMARQIAHDIKNPLTPMKLSLDLLRRARAEQRDDFETILERTMGLMERQVQNLREIATDFYEFTGGRKPRPEQIAVDAIVGEVVELHRAWAESRGIEVVLRLGGESVWADAGKLRRVLTNLVSNAFQAMPEGGRLEIVSSERREADGGRRIRIELLDTGAGLSPDARERLFEPFFTTRSEGTGLGLAIAKRVMEEMGGSIELLPREDERGTLARVELPAPPDRERA
jgi:nitrogen fixation/metabolism regulation signal transduction histidine kinase